MVKQIIKGTKGNWELVIGLEVHAQLSSESKLFSRTSTKFGAEPNSQVSFIDAAMPGMLPILNEKCVEQAVKIGIALNANINKHSVFDRKNYFYADLPQGYQISQFYHPIINGGSIILNLPDDTNKKIRIARMHLEQDAGKSIHDQSPKETYIDLNRSGVALLEIVTEPDIYNSEEAGEFIKKLRAILRCLNACDGDMEKGSLRCDANVSIRPLNDKKLGIRAEIKNLNSIKNIIKAINYEASRQVEILEQNKEVLQETRLFNPDTGETVSMRSKEEAFDYRYFPDPDLLPLVLTEDYIANLKSNMPELPDQKKSRYIEKFAFPSYDAEIISLDKERANYFESVIENTSNPKLVANWVIVELFGHLNKSAIEIKDSPVLPKDLAKLINLLQDDVISGKIAKQVFEIMFKTGKTAEEIVKKHGFKQITDTAAIEKIIDEIIKTNSDKVTQYKNGKEKLFIFFVGQVMKATKGQANPTIVNNLLKVKLSS